MLLYGYDTILVTRGVQFDRLENDSDIFFEEARERLHLIRTSINNSKNQHLLCTMKKVDTASVKLLGFFVDRSLSWENEVYFLTVKRSRTVFLLHRLKQEDGVYYGVSHSHLNYSLQL